VATVLDAKELLLRLHLSKVPLKHRWFAGRISHRLYDTYRYTIDFRDIYEGWLLPSSPVLKAQRLLEASGEANLREVHPALR